MIYTWLSLCDEMDADMRFLAAPKADPTRPDTFMKEVEEERLDLKKVRKHIVGVSLKLK